MLGSTPSNGWLRRERRPPAPQEVNTICPPPPPAPRARCALAVAPLHVGPSALQRMAAAGAPPAVAEVSKRYRLVPAAVQDDVADLFRQARERRFEIEAIMPRERLEHLEVEGVAPVPAADRPGRERERGIGDHAFRIEELAHAQAVAHGAGARRVVEREQPRPPPPAPVPPLRAKNRK